jgi:thiol-disulfide isomerase/thioredoxin
MDAFRDTFVTTRPYIQYMKTFLLAAAVLSISTLAFGQSMMKSTATAGGTGSMMSSNTANDDPVIGSQLRFAASTGHKVIYTDIEAAKALAAKAPTVLFFAADWCPYCQADLREINANGSRLGDVTIVVVDYDKERELERTYGVTVQDTFVQIDSKGARLVAWNSGGVDGILARVKRG